MGCDNNTTLTPGYCCECSPNELGCIPITDGEPEWVPNPDQLPYAFDPTTDCIWMYVCDESGNYWTSSCNSDAVEYVQFIDDGNVTLYDSCTNMDDVWNTGLDFITNRDHFWHNGDPLDGYKLPSEFTYVNPTSHPGILTVQIVMHVGRGLSAANTLNPDAHGTCLFMFGDKTLMDTYDFDDSINNPNKPQNRPEVALDIRKLPVEQTYSFFGKHPVGSDNFGDRSAATHMTLSFKLEAGESITLAFLYAIGFDRTISLATEQQLIWVTGQGSYRFQGQTEL